LKLQKRLGLDAAEPVKAMTWSQRDRFLVAGEADARHYPLFFTATRTGLRLGELLALEWRHCDLQAREIRVERTLAAAKKGLTLEDRLGPPKSRKARTVDVSADVVEALRHLQVQRREAALRAGSTDLPRWVFATEEGTPLDESNVRKAFARTLKSAELPAHFTPHCLRHTYAALLLQMNAPVTYVKEQLGHASIQMTVDTYGRWLPTGTKEWVDRLDAAPVSLARAVNETATLDRLTADAASEAARDQSATNVLLTPVEQPQVVDFVGEPGRNRTFNPQIKSLLLCQLSYWPTRGGSWQSRQR
jgi:integrase